jgi:hypothetical protein
VIAVGAADVLRPYFSSCADKAIFRPPHNVVNDESGVMISACSGPTGPWSSFWSRLKHYD